MMLVVMPCWLGNVVHTYLIIVVMRIMIPSVSCHWSGDRLEVDKVSRRVQVDSILIKFRFFMLRLKTSFYWRAIAILREWLRFHEVPLAPVSIDLEWHVHDRTRDWAEHLCWGSGITSRFVLTNLRFKLLLYWDSMLLFIPNVSIWVLVGVLRISGWSSNWLLSWCIAWLILSVSITTFIILICLLLTVPHVSTRSFWVGASVVRPNVIVLRLGGSSMDFSLVFSLSVYNPWVFFFLKN